MSEVTNVKAILQPKCIYFWFVPLKNHKLKYISCSVGKQ